MNTVYLFPFHLVEKGSVIILYGAGKVFKSFVQQLHSIPYCKILFAVDKNWEKLKFTPLKVLSPDTILTAEYDRIVVAASEMQKTSICEDIASLGVPIDKIICADYPILDRTDITVESLIVHDIFKKIGIRQPSYIDCGACHPHLGSNTALFYNNGSRGINIEANPKLMTEFELYRPNDVNLNIGLAGQSGMLTFYIFANEWLSTFSHVAADYVKATFGEMALPMEKLQVPVDTLNNIVDKYCGGEFPNFLDIDVEGLDYEIIESVDFQKNSPKIICVECPDPTEFDKLLLHKGIGYYTFARIPCNTIYIRADVYRDIQKLYPLPEIC